MTGKKRNAAEPRSSVSDTDPLRLVPLIEMEMDEDRIWEADELAAVLKHQLTAPLSVDLGTLGRGAAGRVKLLAEAEELTLKSLGDLLHHAHPPIELLKLAKRFAKACVLNKNGPLPHDIALVIYYACIVVAMTRCRRRITGLSDDTVRRGLEWGLAQKWVDKRTARIYTDGLKKLQERGVKS